MMNDGCGRQSVRSSRRLSVTGWLMMLLVSLSAAWPVRAQTDEAILTEDVVNAPVEEVWKAWTTKEGIESWMVTKADIELKVGGMWRTSYSSDSNLNDDASIHHVVLAFDPGRMLSFRTVKPPLKFPWPSAIVQTWTVVYLEPVSPAQTKVTIRMLGYRDEDELRQMRAFFETGNRMTLNALKKKFAQ